MCFKQELLKIYQEKCPVSGASKHENDGVHIIQQFVCHRLNLEHLVSDPHNGLLLFTGFHRTFDLYNWSFDVYRAQFSIDLKWCWLPLIVAPHHRLYISEFNEKLVKIPTKSLPYLWVDFQVFLALNFQFTKASQSEIVDLYANIIDSHEFSLLLDDPLSIVNFQSNEIPQVITHHQHLTDQFLVLDQYSSWFNQRWVQREDLSDELIMQYENLVEERSDQTYRPSHYLINPHRKKYHLRKKRFQTTL